MPAGLALETGRPFSRLPEFLLSFFLSLPCSLLLLLFPARKLTLDPNSYHLLRSLTL
jgi:hypothetical protein